MAPTDGAPGKLAKSSARRAASKPVVPVLPLNYPQRPAARPNPSPPASSPPVSNHMNGNILDDHPRAVDARDHHEPATEMRNETGRSPAEDHDAVTPSAVPVQAVSASGSTAPAICSYSPSETPVAPAAFLGQPLASPTPTRPSGPSNPPLNNLGMFGPIRDATAPNFQPAIANRPAFHQPHLSNGSLIFGQLQDSNASSPAPHSGPSFPPPGFMAYPPTTMPVAAVNGYGRPLMVSPTLDGYPPAMVNHHGPPTPHSFHGSQSSVQAEEHGFGLYAPVNGHNGHSGYPTDRSSHGPVHVPGMSSHMNSTQNIGDYPGHYRDDENLAFLRHGINDNTWNDCILEVRFPDSSQHRDHPDYRQLQRVIRIPAHRFVLSRSLPLASLMRSQQTQPGGTVFLDIHNEYMRADVFSYVFRTLYGWPLPLGDGIPLTELRLRDIRDDFQLTLSYIVTAQYLQLEWVYSASVERATQLLCWETLELALAFILPIVAVKPPHTDVDDYKMAKFFNHILDFLIDNYPHDFVLDTSAGNSNFPRLPISSAPSRNANAPPIANGTTGGSHSRQSSMAQAQANSSHRLPIDSRLSQIKFGDISPPVRNGYGPSGPSEASAVRQLPTLNDTIFSRILLNLPFEMLKRVLEHPHLAKLSGEISQPVRHKMIADIIAEREARRLQSLEKGDAQLTVFQEKLENSSKPLMVEQLGDLMVNNMGFKEEVFPGDVPYLTRTWTHMSSPGSSA
ncbi:hypothetical protein B0H66DRAFT_478719 [Apodospora peruviana]|uniref:BTB domain-containing protein n=1 Tax=Apodospora peruviana TaxID=516989 RepID=A0AAE0I169_9PEZI|nr:hypothetical protein B0H66DRAFT_478719 [Apodospora peruviana]